MATCDVQVEGIGQVTQVPASQLRAVHGRDALEEGDEVIVDLKNGKWARGSILTRVASAKAALEPSSAMSMARRALLLLDGLDEGGAKRDDEMDLELVLYIELRAAFFDVIIAEASNGPQVPWTRLQKALRQKHRFAYPPLLSFV